MALRPFSDAPSVTVCGTTAAVQRLEDGRLFVCVRYGSDDGRLEGILPETLPFRDVSRRAWYFESVAYAYRQGLMSGTGTTEFEPDTATSRAMLVQVLLPSGRPARRGRKRLLRCGRRRVVCRCRLVGRRGWIVNGYGNRRFGPDDPSHANRRRPFSIAMLRGMTLPGTARPRFPAIRTPGRSAAGRAAPWAEAVGAGLSDRLCRGRRRSAPPAGACRPRADRRNPGPLLPQPAEAGARHAARGLFHGPRTRYSTCRSTTAPSTTCASRRWRTAPA